MAQQVTTYAGTGTSGYTGDNGLAVDAQISEPYGIVTDIDGNVFFSDQQNNAIRRIDKDSQIISTVVNEDHAGDPILVNDLAIDGDNIYFLDENGGTDNVLKYSITDNVVSFLGSVTESYFGICAKGDSIFLTNSANHTIDLFIISTGATNWFSGATGSSGNDDGSISAASYNFPIAIDFNLDGNLIVGEFLGGSIREINLTTLVVSTIASGMSGIEGVTVAPNGEIYIAVNGSNQIKKIDNSGVISLVAGNGNPGFMDGDPILAEFSSPVKVSVDIENNIYISDNDNYRIRRIGCDPAELPEIKTSKILTAFCSDSEEWYIYVNPNTANLNENEDWVWYENDCGNQELFTGDTLVIKPTQTTSYFVRGEGGCALNSECQEITLIQLDCDTTEIEFVSAFSPNNDGVNDVWIINGLETYFQNKVYIYNRWGDLIVFIENYNNTGNVWRGANSEGNVVSPGTYYYVVEDINNNKLRSGWVQVIR